ncbi:phenolphthiocerol/phthiocerol polyketide synthase subunit C-like [Gigantopelta aegis]|uniref:phenolphthiocerol/phthiocerol polyketide synthase subunit C-like n=1 Tax=Gigantopelta aegis TaxID=1735272 RepID=UPI001B888699|nr:phenolphthiocerol/phthiocerol polyketide synthase subunit C-like [Gigantopelta aegis]
MGENSKGIAIVGVGCRFPGADNIEEFWRVLSKGENHVNEIPHKRWNLEAYYDEDANAPGKMYARRAGLLENFDQFDNKLFGISDKEAERMDPQQKFVLECVFMALQDGGITRQNMQGSDTGVFIGVMSDDYSKLTSKTDLNHYSVTGGSTSIMSARVSYIFDLRGPCMSVDTACSSSLVAIHLGIQALKSGDCNMAVCGGVNALLTPSIFIQLSRARMLSRTGQCQAFSASADGYARGEGCGIVLLKRLSDAIRDGDNIWATIVTGTNQDGRTVSPMTAPSGEQQEQLLKTVYQKAGIDASDIDYIEAHGTGTVAGDPVEVKSLGKFFTDLHKKVQKKRYIGSVKTNIGHLESAAGVAGLIKVLLMMKNNKIVKSLLADKLHPDIDFQKLSFEIPTDLKDWDRQKKIACVNSFAFGGTNCHAVLSSFDDVTKITEEHNMSKVPLMFCFSGQDQKGLTDSIIEFLTFVETQTERNLQAISYSSSVKRDHFQVRKAVTASSVKELVDKLKPGNMLGISHRRKRVIFVFGGMGIAWMGMGKELISEFHVFKEKIQEIDSCLKKYVSWSLYERLLDDYNVEDTMFGPIATFACQVALAALWKHLGIKPDCVLGQSVGEVAASHVAGIWSLSEALKIIFHRTDVLANVTGGKMLLVRNRPVEKHEKMLTKYEGRANIGLYYSPKTCVISGDTDAVDQIEKDLLTSSTDEKHGIILQTLKLKTAFHSHHTNTPKQDIQRKLAGMQGNSPDVEIISTVSGEKAQEEEFSTPHYWGKNIRDPVQFGKAVVNAAKGDCFNIFVEIGPKPVLGSGINDLFTEDNIAAVPSMKRNSELSCLLETAGKIYEHGLNVIWNALYASPQQNTKYPKYRFCTTKHLYVSEDVRQELMGMQPKTNLHPFLKTVDHSGEHKIILSPKSIASVYEHRYSGNILLPAALYAEAGLAIARLYFKKSEHQNCSISMKFKRPVLLIRGETEQLDIDVTKMDIPESFTFVVYKQNHVYAEGKVEREHSSHEITVDIENVKMRCRQTVTKQELYSALQNGGLSFGDMLQLVGKSFKSETEVLSHMSLNPTIRDEMKETTIHPAILDAMLHTAGCFYQHAADRQKALPIQIEGLTIRRSVENKMLVHTTILKRTNSMNMFHISLISLDGYVIAEIEKFVTKNLSSQKEEMMFQTKWNPTKKLIKSNIQMDPLDEWLIINDKRPNAIKNKHIHFEYLASDGTRNDLGTTLQAKYVNLETWSAIVFLCQQQTGDQPSSETITEVITRQAMTLRSVLLHLHTHNASIPLFIVTENAVHIGNKVSSVDLVGGSCWGFVRSVLREQVYSMTTIVDIHTDENSTFDTLMTATVQQLLLADNQGLNECVVDGHLIWCQQVFPNDEMPQYRNNKLDSLCKAKLLSGNEGILGKLHLTYGSQEAQSDLPQPVEIMTTRVVMHGSYLYPQCAPDSNIVTLELTGTISTGNDAQQNVVAFFPCRVSTSMTVPKQCVIDITKMPCYVPGLLTKLFLFWHHCILIDKQMETPNTMDKFLWWIQNNCYKTKNDMEIFIIYSNDTRLVAKALLLMLKTVKRNTTIKIVDINSSSLAPRYSEAVILSTILLNEYTIKIVCNMWPIAKRLVCMDQLLPTHANLQLCHQNLKLQIQLVRTSDIFTPRSAMDTMPNLITWILGHKSEVKTIAETLQHVAPQEKETNVTKLMENSTIQLCGNADHNIPNVLASEDALLRLDGVYIVVGGLTGLGWECVQFLAKREAGAVVILNRRKTQEDKVHKIGKIEKEYGCEINVMQVDVTNMAALKKAFKTIEDTFPRKQLKGVYFGAGVLEDRTLVNMSQDTFMKVAAPKIQGAWNIHVLTENKPLDFFIMHSSVASVFGNGGQSNYGAANAFQDSLAQKRRLAGLVGQSVNWGPLNLGMLQDKPDVMNILEEQGYIPLSTEEIHQCLLSVLMLDKPTIIAAKFNFIKLANSVTNEKNTSLEFKLSSIVDVPTLDNLPKETLSRKHHIDIEQLKITDIGVRLETIREYITELLTDVLGLNKVILELDTGVENLGLDSMQAMTMSNQIHQTFQVRITPNGLLQQNLSVNEIADLINTKFTTSTDNLRIQDVSSLATEQTLTYMEYTFYKIYCNNPADPSLYYINEISIPESVAEPELWKKIAEQLMSRHEVLRTIFEIVSESENIRWNVKRKINPVEMSPDFRMVDGEDIDEIDKHTAETFHLETQGPLRFIYIRGKICHFRTVYNSIGFDMQGIGIIFKDMVDIFLSIQHNVHLQELQTVGGSLIVVEMEKVLQETGQALKNFWKNWLQVEIPVITLGTPEQPQRLKSRKYLQEKITLEPAIYDALLDLSKSKGLSIYKLITSFYQLLLHLMTNERNVAISTTVDVKQYIPNVGNAVGLGTNYIPLLAKFTSDNISVEEFLENNKAALQMAIDHCVCPLDIISELVSSQKITNIIRNKVVIVEDEFVTPLLSLAKNAGYTFNVTKSEDLGTHTETQFSMWSRTKEKQLTVDLTYNSNSLSSRRAKDIMKAFQDVVTEVINDISVTTACLRNMASIIKLRTNHNQNCTENPSM